MSQKRKLSYKQLRPYRVRKAIPKKGTHLLEEFDGTELAGTYSGNRLKKFVERNRFYTLVADESTESSDSKSGCQEDSDKDEDLSSIKVPVRRSARIRQNAQEQQDTLMLDADLEDEAGEELIEPELEELGCGFRV